MARHEKCNLFVDNFIFEYLGMDCPTCAALGEAHLCGSHPQRINVFRQQTAGCGSSIMSRPQPPVIPTVYYFMGSPVVGAFSYLTI